MHFNGNKTKELQILGHWMQGRMVHLSPEKTCQTHIYPNGQTIKFVMPTHLELSLMPVNMKMKQYTGFYILWFGSWG